MLHVYGIKNCSTVKKALTYLDEHHHEYQFHDFKKEPPTKTQIQTWFRKDQWYHEEDFLQELQSEEVGKLLVWEHHQ